MKNKKEMCVKTGNVISAARKNAGITQKQLSEKIGVTQDYLSSAENGSADISLETAKKLCNLLGISIEVLAYGEKLKNDSFERLIKKLENMNEQDLNLLEKVTDLFFMDKNSEEQ